MAGFSTFLSNKVLDHVFRNVAYTAPATVYLAAFTVAPTDAGGGTELTAAGGYARQAITLSAAAASATSNTAAITFGPATGASWGTIIAVGIFDALTAGNLLKWATSTNKLIDVGDSYQFPIGDLDLTLD